VDPKKIEVMKDWPRLKTLHGLHDFMGLIGIITSLFRIMEKLPHLSLISSKIRISLEI